MPSKLKVKKQLPLNRGLFNSFLRENIAADDHRGPPPRIEPQPPPVEIFGQNLKIRRFRGVIQGKPKPPLSYA